MPKTSLVLAAVAAAVLTGAAQAHPAATCSPQALHIRATRVEGSAGTFLIHLRVRTAAGRCALFGFPRLRIIGHTGPLATRVQHGGLAVLNQRARQITLTRTRAARLLVAYNDVPVGAEKACPAGIALDVGRVRVNVATHACHGGRLLESPYLGTP